MVQHTTPLEPDGSRGISRVPQGSPPCADLGGGEVRGRSSLAVSAGAAGTAAVEAGKEQGVHYGVQHTTSLEPVGSRGVVRVSTYTFRYLLAG